LPVGFDEEGLHLLHHQEGAGDVHRISMQEVFAREGIEIRMVARVLGDAGIVDEDVEAARLGGGFRQLRTAFIGGDVGLDETGLCAGLLAIGNGGFAVRDRLGAIDDDAGAALGEAECDRAAEAGGRSGDEGAAAFEISWVLAHVVSSGSFCLINPSSYPGAAPRVHRKGGGPGAHSAGGVSGALFCCRKNQVRPTARPTSVRPAKSRLAGSAPRTSKYCV
jgi:hypothetical protein